MQETGTIKNRAESEMSIKLYSSSKYKWVLPFDYSSSVRKAAIFSQVPTANHSIKNNCQLTGTVANTSVNQRQVQMTSKVQFLPSVRMRSAFCVDCEMINFMKFEPFHPT